MNLEYDYFLFVLKNASATGNNLNVDKCQALSNI